MKIVYTSRTPLAGVCELMCRIVNEYTEHEARVLNKGPGKHRWYCRPGVEVPRYSIGIRDQINESLEWADVVHCMANVSARYFKRLDLLKKKVWVFQWHGAQIWPFSNVWCKEDFAHVRWIHIGQGWIEGQMDFFGPFIEKWGMKVIPNLITVDDEIHRPIPWGGRKCRVAFAPSQSNEGKVNRKGIPQVTGAVKGLCRLELIQSTPFELCMRKKQASWLGIDEVVTPMYHRSGLEFLSQGVPCICSYTEATERVLLEATGANRMPFLNATSKTLRSLLSSYFRQPEENRAEMGREAREWIEKYYHPRDLVKRHLEVYEKG